MWAKNKRKKIEHWHAIAFCLTFYDIIAVNLSYLAALWVRFDCRYSQIPQEYLDAYLKFVPFYTVFVLLVFRALRLYKSVWRFASYNELIRIFAASVITSAAHTVGITLFLCRMPVSYYLIGTMLQFLMTVAVRFSYRFVLLERSRLMKKEVEGPVHNVMIIGAGAAGQVILRDIEKSKEARAKVRCMIDDNANKWGRYIESVPIVGGRDDILYNVEKHKIDRIMFAIPTATAEEKRDIMNICKETSCEIKVLPGIYQLVNGEVSLKKMKDVAVEDLLGRESIKVNMDEICQYIQGKTVLVTGGGGSIGSELCRQIARHSPRRLIIFDIYENNAYDVEQELRTNYPGMDLRVLIGSVRDSRRIEGVFEKYRPEIVYHAAAHKHVPLMESSPCESIKNNVMGTYKTAYAALKNGCQRFVLVSTDKAVNPTNIMGASKRLCEMVIQCMDMVSRNGRDDLLAPLRTHFNVPFEPEEHSGVRKKPEGKRTEFVAVRFGNVLGSNGSVIPLFKKQIARGGPVTVTHPDIVRYFMTIPEAVSLVLQAGCYAKGGEIFVLDMGSPVKIDTLARNLIKLSGYKPDVDIRIEYTGLRPGEKLYEEKLMAEEGLKKTPNHLIHVGHPIPFDVEVFLKQLEKLTQASYENREDSIRKMVTEIVPPYHPAGKHGCMKKGEVYEELLKEAAAAEELDVSGSNSIGYR